MYKFHVNFWLFHSSVTPTLLHIIQHLHHKDSVNESQFNTISAAPTLKLTPCSAFGAIKRRFCVALSPI